MAFAKSFGSFCNVDKTWLRKEDLDLRWLGGVGRPRKTGLGVGLLSRVAAKDSYCSSLTPLFTRSYIERPKGGTGFEFHCIGDGAEDVVGLS